jgi:hypothetical protein
LHAEWLLYAEFTCGSQTYTNRQCVASRFKMRHA